MTARFIPPDYPGGRIVLRSGEINVGAIFPPALSKGKWRWCLFCQAPLTPTGTEKTEEAARAAILSAWHDSLDRMALREIDP